MARRNLVERDLAKARGEQGRGLCHGIHHHGVDVLFHQALGVLAAVTDREKIGAAERFIDV